ncbi:MAG: type IV secretory system conjugative DNA transfer family protein, partial [Dietzia sp.]|nr:type IV secretory system conjugative DNA transfer family protein [Dietzia sp.]
MNTTNNRRKEPGKAGNDTPILVLALTGVAAIIGFAVSMKLGSDMDGINAGITADPFAMIEGLRKGTYSWPASGTWIAGCVLIGIALLGVWVLRAMAAKGRSAVDHAARYMATPKQMTGMQEKQALVKSARLGVPKNAGVPMGRMMLGGRTLFASFEDMMILIAGPRVGKSTSLVIPAITAAPGAVVTTSNKRDVLDATRDLRAQAGDVWVFDPQRVALEEPTWWWNPLSYVTDDTKAAKLAEHFSSGTTAAGSKTDPYFEGKGKDLLAGLLLAAAVGNRPITDVYDWLSDVTRTEHLEYLEASGYRRMADGVTSVQRMVDKQRDSIYSSAERMAACLKNTGIERWVNPDPSPLSPRPEFNPHEFVKGTGTLYSLSKEGAGTAGPLVTALTAATIEAAEELASNSPGGRVQTPLLGLLDEAANVCR